MILAADPYVSVLLAVLRDHRKPCLGGCGRLVWHATIRTGYCRTCLGVIRRTAEHGSEARYRTGCRCVPCREAASAKRRERRHANAEATRAYDREYKRRTRAAA